MPKLGIHTEKQKQFIRENRLEGSRFISEKLGVSRTTVQKYLRENNLSLTKKEVNALRSRKRIGKTSFTPQMDKFIQENYLTMPIKAMAKKIGKSYCGINLRMKKLNLVIPAEIIEKNKRKNQFKKGQAPKNKGKKLEEYLTPEQIKIIEKNQFKKGNIPHNNKPVGTITEHIDTCGKAYLIKKVAKPDKWEFIHRLVYKKHFGKIKKGYLIAFKDGNTKNIAPENLEMISKAENARRNIEGFRELPEELQTTIKLKNKLLKNLK
ncbi:HNH endonuclease signature motif containing protein [Mesonia aquimarina]|uniref:HNH endonuclease signature motif containing protein n=1 Tax=Mesonia aquimarina TaxID=1504967 RepID=UPI000EF5A68A|nr:HNH endonuclease signature motif containing protein [Mesonia aquimarina]